MGRIRRALGGLLKIIKIIVCAIGIILLLVILWPVVMAVISVVTSIIPGVIAAVNWLVGLVMRVIKPVLDLLKPAFDALKNIYDNWVKPVLTKVQSTVDLVRDNVYKVYNLTIGGVTQTYNNLFGWVDGLQTQFNGFADRLIGLVSVVDQKAADRLDAMRGDVNRTIDKYSSDLFDKVITKINETAGPILTKVDEFAAAVNEKLQHALDLGERSTSYLDGLTALPHTAEEASQPVIMATEAQSDRNYEEASKPAEMLQEKKVEKKTVWDVMFERWFPFKEKDTVWFMEEMEAWVDEMVQNMYIGGFAPTATLFRDVESLVEGELNDDMLRWMIGEITFGEFLHLHAKEIADILLWPVAKEPQKVIDGAYWKGYDDLIKGGWGSDDALKQVNYTRSHRGLPPLKMSDYPGGK